MNIPKGFLFTMQAHYVRHSPVGLSECHLSLFQRKKIDSNKALFRPGIKLEMNERHMKLLDANSSLSELSSCDGIL